MKPSYLMVNSFNTDIEKHVLVMMDADDFRLHDKRFSKNYKDRRALWSPSPRPLLPRSLQGANAGSRPWPTAGSLRSIATDPLIPFRSFDHGIFHPGADSKPCVGR